MKTRPSSVKERVTSILVEKTVKQGGAVEGGSDNAGWEMHPLVMQVILCPG